MANLDSVVYCDRHRADSRFFKSLNPKFVDSQEAFETAFLSSTPSTLWISPHINELFSFLARMSSHRQLSQRRRPMLLSLGPIQDQRTALVYSCFSRVIEADGGRILAMAELSEALVADHSADLMIGGFVDHEAEVITLVRGDLFLPPVAVPFSAFKESGTGVKPNFKDFEIADFGQTIRLGKYEAAAASLLYEFDPEFRKRKKAHLAASEKSFGASLRRLRIQKGLIQSDFAGINPREIGRIERGEVNQPQERTIARLSKALGVKPDEIGSF